MRRHRLLALLAALSVVALAIGVFLEPAPEVDELARQADVPSASAVGAESHDPPQLPEAPPIQSLGVAWQKPLFNPERAPDAQRTAARTGVDLTGILLTGVVIDGERRVALFKQPGGASLALKEGATLREGWRIRRIESRRVELYNDSESRVMQLTTPRLPTSPTPAPTPSREPIRP